MIQTYVEMNTESMQQKKNNSVAAPVEMNYKKSFKSHTRKSLTYVICAEVEKRLFSQNDMKPNKKLCARFESIHFVIV